MRICYKSVGQTQHEPGQPAMGTEFVPTVTSHTCQDERLAAPACHRPVTKVAKLVHQHHLGPQKAQGCDQLGEDLPRLVWMVNLVHRHSQFSQDGLVVSPTAEVKKTQINTGVTQRPGNVNGLLFGSAPSQAGSDHGQAQTSRLSIHDWEIGRLNGLYLAIEIMPFP